MSAVGGSVRVEAATSARKIEISALQRESCLWTGIALTLVGLFAAISVYSWTPGDGWAFMQTGSATGIQNLAGRLGNWLGTHLLSLYGYAAYLAPPALAAWGIYLCVKRSMAGQWLRLAGCFVLLTCLMLMLGSFGSGAKGDAGSELPCGAGGVAGSVVLAPAMKNLLGPAGTAIFAGALVVGSLYLIWAGFILACVRSLTTGVQWAGQASQAALAQGRRAFQPSAAVAADVMADAQIGGAQMHPAAVTAPKLAVQGAVATPGAAQGMPPAALHQRVRVGSISAREGQPAQLVEKQLKHVATDDLPATAAPWVAATPMGGVKSPAPTSTTTDGEGRVEPQAGIDSFDLPTDCLDLPVTAKQAHREPPPVEISEIEIAWETHKRQEMHLENDSETVEETDAMIAIARAAAAEQEANPTVAAKAAPGVGRKGAGAEATAITAEECIGNDSADHAEIVQLEGAKGKAGLKVKKRDNLEAEKKAARSAAKKERGGEDREPGDLAIVDKSDASGAAGNREPQTDENGLRSHPKLKWEKYEHPPIDTLHAPIGKNSIDEVVLRERGRKLTMMLARYKVDVNVVKIIPGPSLTTYEVKLAATTTASEVQKREKEMALELMVEGVRITPPIQGRGTIGIEVPNQSAESIVLRELMETENYSSTDCALPIVIGKDSLGKPVILDLAKTPHMLMAGATGMGKSVGLNAILLSIMMCKKPWEVKFLMIDPKAVELDIFDEIPHMMHPIVTDMTKAKKLLDFCVWEMDRRYKLMRACRVRNIREYNALDHKDRVERFMPGVLELCDLTPYLPYIVLVVEEWADLYNTNKEEAVDPVQRIAQKARAAGIHMILTTQNPTVKCLPGLIKSNVPTRLAYRVGQRIDSQVILDATGAEKLVHRGEFLLKNVEGRMTRGQGAYVSTEEVERVTNHLRDQGAPEYDQEIQEAMSETCDEGAKAEAVSDKLFFQAVELMLNEERASTSILQRRMNIGYNRAARLVDLMHKLNIVGPVNGAKPRDILITAEQWAEMKADLVGKGGGAVAAATGSDDDYGDFAEADDSAKPARGTGSFSEFEREGRRKVNGDVSNDEIADDNGGEKY